MVTQETSVVRKSARLERILALMAEIDRKHREGQPLWSAEGLAEAHRAFDDLEGARKAANTVAVPDD